MTIMQNLNGAGRNHLRGNDPLPTENTEELELAFGLQNAEGGNLRLLELITRRYAGQVYRWISAWLYYQHGAEAPEGQVMRVMQEVFSDASMHPEQFLGQESVLDWLLALSYRILKKQSYIEKIRIIAGSLKRRKDVWAQEKTTGWESLKPIPEKLRTPMILRAMFNMRLEDIASILNIQMDEAHKRLVACREGLMAGPLFADRAMRGLLQDYTDGFFENDLEGTEQIKEHIEICDECRSFITGINKLEKSLADSLEQHWPTHEFDQSGLQELAKDVSTIIQQARHGWRLKFNLRQAAWIGGLCTLFGLMMLVIMRLPATEQDFAQVGVTATPALPPVIDMQPEIAAVMARGNYAPVPQYIDPAISRDGKWMVFASIKEDLASMDLSLPTISIYSLEDNTFKVISENGSALKIPWLWWDLTPSISGDGQRIVYVSSSDDMRIPGYPCKAHDGSACLDIFVYDQARRSTKRISQAVYGGSADGDSLAPVISEDGNWVAFWSAADNLVVWDKVNCQTQQASITCLYLYLYNLQDGTVTQIPVQNRPGDEIFGADKISLSADGRYVGFTKLQAGQTNSTAAETPAPMSPVEIETGTGTQNPAIQSIEQSSEAVIYDQQTGKYELLNSNQLGEAGNGPSSSPVLSSKGRYVAFISSASNLVNGDENHSSDIFIKDRISGEIELASRSTPGLQGNDDSGSTYVNRGFFSLDISADGRYVIFVSKASNLTNDVEKLCSQRGLSSCYGLYAHDQQTGSTDLISVLDGRGFTFFPALSADGRWVSFTQYSYNCAPRQFICSNVMLYDRQREWLSNLTQYEQQPPGLPWSDTTSLELPWQAWESRGLTISPDGKLMAVGGYDAKIRLWKIFGSIHSVSQAQPDAVISLDTTDAISAVAFSQDSSWVAAGTNSGSVEIWKLSSSRRLYTLPSLANPIIKIIFAPDGKHMLISTQDEVRWWRIDNGEVWEEKDIYIGSRAIFALDINPDGTLLATGRGDGTVWLQDLASGKVVGRLGGLQVAAYNVAFSPDGSLLAARSAEGITNVWNIVEDEAGNLTFKLFSQFQSNEYAAEWVFSPDNKYLASTGIYGQVTLFGVLDGKFYSLTPPTPSGKAYGVAFSNDGDLLAGMFENRIVLWGIGVDSISAFFVQSGKDTFVGSPPQPASTANDIPELEGNRVVNGSFTIEEARGILDFPLLVPANLPQNINFLDASVNKDGSVTLRYAIYEGQSYQDLLFIYEQAISDDQLPKMTVGKSANIQAKLIDTHNGWVKAEYVQGDWREYTSYMTTDTDSAMATSYQVWNWSNLSGSQRLRWQQEGILVALYDHVNPAYIRVLSDPAENPYLPGLTHDDLLQIAAGMAGQ